MSKGDDPNKILERILEALREGTENKYRSQTLRDESEIRAQEQYSIVNLLERASEKHVKQIGKVIMQTLSSMGVRTQQGFKSGDFDRFEKTLSNFVKENNVSIKSIFDAAQVFIESKIDQTNLNERKGKKGPLKDVYGNENQELKAILAELRKSTGAQGAIDSAMTKVAEFVTGSPFKKTLRAFGADLIEGLEKSKWVGGAVRDGFRLLGLLGAQWLSQFGKFGRILGGAFYVAMEAFGPVLTNIIVQGMLKGLGGLTKALWTLVGSLGSKAGWGIINALPQNGPLGNLITTMYMGGNKAQAGSMGAAIRGMIVPGITATAAFAGAGFAGYQAVDSWKQGKKGNATALGLGGGLLAAGGIAALVAGMTATVTVPLLAIGAAVTAIAFGWKKYGDDIQKHYKRNKDFYDKVFKFMDYTMPVFGILRNAINWWIEHFGEGTNIEDSEGNRNSGFQKLQNALGFQDTTSVGEVSGGSKAQLNKYGGVIGLEKVDKMTASRIAEDYFKNNPKQAFRMYEKVGSKYASLGDFQNDWAIRNSQGQAVAAILHQGASNQLQGLWDFLGAQKNAEGVNLFNANRIEMLKYTSGRSTKSSPHKGKGINSHENIAAMVTDLGAADWTDAEWEAALPFIQDYMKQFGYRVRFEGNYQGAFGQKTYIGEEFRKGLTNRHLHVDMMPGAENLAPEGVKETLKEYNQKVIAQTPSIAVAEILKSVDSKTYDILQNADAVGVNPDPNAYEKALEAKGVVRDSTITSSDLEGYLGYSRNNHSEFAVVDSSGNVTWKSLAETGLKIQQFGTN